MIARAYAGTAVRRDKDKSYQIATHTPGVKYPAAAPTKPVDVGEMLNVIRTSSSTLEKSSVYEPVVAPLDTFDYNYKDDPIHEELMKELFESDNDSEEEEMVVYDAAIELAVNHLQSLVTSRGNSRG